jgi:hypothetical protein
MPFQNLPRPVFVLASVLATGLMLTVASCSHVTPLGPDAAPAVPQPHHLRSPFVLQDVSLQTPTQAGGCPSGSVASSGGPVQCYRDVGKPVTVTSAGVSPLTSFQPPTPSGQQAVPTQYGFWITLPAAAVPALTAIAALAPPVPAGSGPVTSSAAGAVIFVISVAGRTWVPIGYSTQASTRQLEVMLATRDQAVQLQGTLTPAG